MCIRDRSESYLGHDWCKYWFHVNHLNDRAGKMSKSKGAILTVSVLQEKGYNPLAYRFFCLQSHYRKPLEFSFDALDNAVAAYNKIAKRVAELKDEGDIDETAFADFKKKFTDAVSNDLNTSMAITIVYDVLKADISDRTKPVSYTHLDVYKRQGDDMPTLVIATVEGDIHDIGKNLVVLMLKNYGYNVIDMGKDVPCEDIVNKAIETNAAVIGLSALMTLSLIHISRKRCSICTYKIKEYHQWWCC